MSAKTTATPAYNFPQALQSKALADLKFTVYCGTLVHTPRLGDLDIIPNARVGVNSDGVIVYINKIKLVGTPVEEAREFDATLTEVEVINISSDYSASKFFFPGFIDTHIHAPQYPNCGVFGNSTLFSWLTKYTYPVEMVLQDPFKALAVYDKVVNKTLTNGTTTCAYYATLHPEPTNILADCCFKYGQRAFIGRSCMDCGKAWYSDTDLQEGIKSTIEVIDHCTKRDPSYKIIKPILSPRNANKCTKDYMLWLADKAKADNLPIQAHLSETKEEVDDIMKSFPECKTYTEIYDNHNLLTSQTVLGHCVFLSDEELAMINERGSSISHCPTSNSCLTSGEARVRWMLDKNSKVSLGTDVSGGYSPSILTTARHAVLVSRHVAMKTKKDHDKLSVNESLYLATLGGAIALNLHDQIGSFEVGKKWECQLIDFEAHGSPIDLFDFLNPSVSGIMEKKEDDLTKFQDLIDKWVFNGDDRNVRQVYVNGRCVVDKGI